MNLSIVTKEMFGQREMNIYQNESNDIFMTREQIGNALEYSEPVIAISKLHIRNRNRLDNFSVVTRLVSADGKPYETTIYNEKGIYEIARKSGQPKADEFYDWVYDLLSKLRKGEAIIGQPMSIEDMIISQAQSVKEIKNDVSMLKDNMRIDSSQEFHLNRLGKKKVLQSLGGYKSPAYEEMSGKVFARFWRDFKQHFVIPRYSDLPKIKFDEGVAFIKAWQPDTSTRLEIQSINRQQTIRGVI
ncbi:MAG TPA: ORF6C domain-containing protein [Pseudogracilibacillus sp.]|nr:ORF6C domain-containing protein [Pseudogracilibacillus sp.]